MKLLIILAALTTVHGYNILCIQSVASRSHYNIMYGIIKPLLKAGHEITFMTTFPESNPSEKLKIIDISPVKIYLEELHKLHGKVTIPDVQLFARNVTKDVVKMPEVRQTLLSSNIDLVVSEWFFSDIEAGYAAVLQVPWILVSGMVMHPHLEYLVDTVRSIPSTPGLMKHYPMPLSFTDRVLNTVTFLQYAFNEWLDHSTNENNYKSFFGPLADQKGILLPPYKEASHNISILFVNSHTTHAPALSLPPNVVDIGGYHIDEHPPPLPQDLQSILDSSPQGVIYFSLGSVFRSSGISEKTRKDLLNLFSGLPYTVLWKFDEVFETPKNVYIRTWMPQASILAHPNVKVFISHCGLLSTLEAIHFGVPLLGVPIFGDQQANAQRAAGRGYALKIDFSETMAEDMAGPLREILTNDSYYKKAKNLSKIFRRRPSSPSDLIRYYVDLAIESKGAPHLRSSTHLYSWHEIWMLDQVAVLTFILYLLYKIIKIACSYKFNKKQKTQ